MNPMMFLILKTEKDLERQKQDIISARILGINKPSRPEASQKNVSKLFGWLGELANPVLNPAARSKGQSFSPINNQSYPEIYNCSERCQPACPK
jgi:hypothetical protein